MRRLLLREVRLREVDRRALLRRLARRRGFDTLLDFFERLREREAEEPLFTLLTEGSRGVLALLRRLERAAALRRVRRAARRFEVRRLLLGEADDAGAGAFGTLDRR